MKNPKQSIRNILAECLCKLYPKCYDDKHIDEIHKKLFSLFLTNLNDQELKNQLQKESIYWNGQDEENYNCLKLLRMKAFNTI